MFCIHSLTRSRDSFRHLESHSEFRSCSILAPDLLGFGSSDQPEDFSYTMQDHAKICAQILLQVDYERLHLVAHSMGGAIALLLPSKILDSAESFANIEGNLTAEDCGIVSRRIVEASFEEFNEKILPEHTLQFAGYAPFNLTSPSAYYRSAQSLVEWSDSRKLLNEFLKLRCRKAYFYGEENRNHPTVLATKSVRQIEIKKSGHYLMEDNPTDFYTELSRFIRKK